jgi:hypothetical protein
MNWLWYTISVAFLFIGSMSLIFLIIVLKRRAQNGFWSRENHLHDFNHNHKKTSSSSHKHSSSHSRPSRGMSGLFSCAKAHGEDDLIDSHKSNFNLELKTCHLRNHQDRFVATTPGIMHFDEYSTNSLYGTIDRLIVKKNNSNSNSNNTNVTTTTSSGLGSSIQHQQMQLHHHQQQQQIHHHHHQQQQQLQQSSCSVLYTNNYNSITKDPKMMNSHKSYVIANGDDVLDKNEIHF